MSFAATYADNHELCCTLVVRLRACRGTLPPAWQQFGRLQVLLLSFNRLTGTLPVGLGCGDSFTVLLHLDVSNNRLTGNLPAGCNLTAGSVGAHSCGVAHTASLLQFM